MYFNSTLLGESIDLKPNQHHGGSVELKESTSFVILCKLGLGLSHLLYEKHT